MTRKKLSNLLVALLCLVMAIPTVAASPGEGDISPRYVVLSKFEAALEIGYNGYNSCTGESVARTNYTADVTMELQRKEGNSWETIKMWTDSGRRVSLNEGWYVLSGYDYRVKLSAEVKNSSGEIVENAVTYSVVQHY